MGRTCQSSSLLSSSGCSWLSDESFSGQHTGHLSLTRGEGIASTAGIACSGVVGHMDGAIFSYRNAPVVGGHAGGSTYLQNCQVILTLPACTVLAEALEGRRQLPLWLWRSSVACPLFLFTLLLLSIATDFQVVALHRTPRLRPRRSRSTRLIPRPGWGTHNPLVEGSSPSGPTILIKFMAL